MHVVDHDERRIGDEPVQQRLDRLRDPLRHEPFVEGGRLGGRRQVEPKDEAEQWQPRLETGSDGGDGAAQPPLDLATGGMRPELQRPPNDLPDGHVRLVRVNLSALDPHCAPARHVSAQLAEQTGLPQARVARDDHERSLPLAREGERREKAVELGLASDEGPDGLRLALAARRADVGGTHELCLALRGEWLDSGNLVGRAGTLQHVLANEELPVGGSHHDPRRRVDRVAVERIRASRRGPDDSCEYSPRVHANTHRERSRALHDRAGGPEHELLLVSAGASRGAGEQDRLHRLLAHVGLRERDIEAQAAFLDRGDPLVERARKLLRSLPFQQLVRIADLDERHCDVTMLGIGRLTTQLARVRRRQEVGEVDA